MLLTISYCTSAYATSPASKPIHFGVFPFTSQLKLESIFAPIAKELRNDLGIAVKYRSARSMSMFIERLRDASYDLAFIQPFDYVRYAKAAGYIPLVGIKNIRAVFVTRSDSDIKQIQDLAGKSIATLPPVAAVTHLAQSVLLDSGIIPGRDITLEYVRTHINCMQLVLSRHVSSCVTTNVTLRTFQKEYGVKLKVIGQSQSIVGPGFVVHQRLPEKLRGKIKKYLVTNNKHIFQGDKTAPLHEIEDGSFDSTRKIWENLSQTLELYR